MLQIDVKPATHVLYFLFHAAFQGISQKKKGIMWNVLLHTFSHFHEILIFYNCLDNINKNLWCFVKKAPPRMKWREIRNVKKMLYEMLQTYSSQFSLFSYASIRLLSLGAPFQYVFSISVALSLSMMHKKHYPRTKWREGGRKEHKMETNCICVWGNKKNFKNHIIGSIITSKDSLSVEIHK